MTPPNIIFGDPEFCTYCGTPPDCLDHVIPVSSYSNKPDEKRNGGADGGLRTYCCESCNAHLGSKVFETFKARLAFVQKRLTKQLGKFDKDGDWTDEEILALNGYLRTYVAHRQIAKQQAEASETWVGSAGFWKSMSTLYTFPQLDRESTRHVEWLTDYFVTYI